MNKNILIIGNCGVGKTWVMKQILQMEKNKSFKLGMFCFHESENIIITGKYDNSTFEGSDKLSMAVMKDLQRFNNYCKGKNKTVIFEGDRFTNSKFIEQNSPTIIKIKGTGIDGREKRKSNQTDGHLKRIETRVKNITANITVENSTECVIMIKKIIYEKS